MRVHRPTATALRARARALLEHMIEQSRWIHALPTDEAETHAAATFAAHGFVPRAGEGDDTSKRWTNDAGTSSLTLVDHEELEITLVEAQGAEAPEPLGALLRKAGFYAQSALIESALDVETNDARKALLTLAHMLVAWDDEWTELFRGHLASADAAVREDAVASIALAAAVARAPGPAPMLLREALTRGNRARGERGHREGAGGHRRGQGARRPQPRGRLTQSSLDEELILSGSILSTAMRDFRDTHLPEDKALSNGSASLLPMRV